MWEAFFAFHIPTGQAHAELAWRPIGERTVRPLAFVLLTVLLQRLSNIVEDAEPMRIETFIAQPAVEALHVTVLQPYRLDVD